jgi:ribosomal protein L28
MEYIKINQEIIMAKKCDVCGRGSTKDASRSHSNIKTIKRQYINLQIKKVNGKKLNVCAKCIKTMAKKKK